MDCDCRKVRSCKICQKRYNQEWYRNNREAHKRKACERRKIVIAANKEYIRNAKNNPCMDCGESFPYYVMDFDHRDPSSKKNIVSKLYTSSLKIVKEEIAKCDLVCSNCHRVRTFNRIS